MLRFNLLVSLLSRMCRHEVLDLGRVLEASSNASREGLERTTDGDIDPFFLCLLIGVASEGLSEVARAEALKDLGAELVDNFASIVRIVIAEDKTPVDSGGYLYRE